MRASDADREQVTERLRHAAAEGRLLAHELDERLGRALRAKTYGELDATVSDLPGSVPAQRSRSRQLARQHPVATVALVAAATVTVAVVVAVVIAWFLMAWGLWLMIALIVMANRRSHGSRERQGPRDPQAPMPHGGGFRPGAHAGWDRWR